MPPHGVSPWSPRGPGHRPRESSLPRGPEGGALGTKEVLGFHRISGFLRDFHRISLGFLIGSPRDFLDFDSDFYLIFDFDLDFDFGFDFDWIWLDLVGLGL